MDEGLRKSFLKTKEQLKGDFDSKYVQVYKKQFSDFNRVFKKMTDEGVLMLLSPDDGMFNVPGFAMVEEMNYEARWVK